MSNKPSLCPDCDALPESALSRRDFLKAVGVTTAAAALPLAAVPRVMASPSPKSAAETAVKGLFDTLTPEQRKAVCFDWDYTDKARGLLRTHVSNNWQITPHHIRGNFYTKKQQMIVHDIFKGLINPEWYPRFLKQLRDDTDGKEWGTDQSIGIFGTPGTDKFEFVMTGRHMTLRADGNTESHVAFGGPIFYGHAASGFDEAADHPGNVFWPQALAANRVYQMLDPAQRKKSLVAVRPRESAVGFRGKEEAPGGLLVAEMAAEQKLEMQKVLMSLVEPFRKEDQTEALACLKRQGGIDRCTLTFYQEADLGNDEQWDNWRLEGPSFVWYFRGSPHVHVWVNVADSAAVQLNARG